MMAIALPHEFLPWLMANAKGYTFATILMKFYWVGNHHWMAEL